MHRTIAVYVVTHITSGAQYVGISHDPVRRFRAHRAAALRGSQTHFARALAKHGHEQFKFQVLGHCETLATAKAAEIALIKCIQPAYNSTRGGDGAWGAKHSAETCLKRGLKISAAKLGRPLLKRRGCTFTAEHRAKLSAAAKNRPKRQHTLEHCANISAAKAGKSKSAEHKQKLREAQTGRKLSSETRAKMSQSQRDRWAHKKAPCL